MTRRKVVSNIGQWPVSYTHLDVYKRQGTNPADAAVYVDKVRERAGLAKLKDSQWKDCLSSNCLLYTSRCV